MFVGLTESLKVTLSKSATWDKQEGMIVLNSMCCSTKGLEPGLCVSRETPMNVKRRVMQ